MFLFSFGGIPILSMEMSKQKLFELMDEGITRWDDLKANGVRHTTLRRYRFVELKRRIIQIQSEELNTVCGCTLIEVMSRLNCNKL